MHGGCTGIFFFIGKLFFFRFGAQIVFFPERIAVTHRVHLENVIHSIASSGFPLLQKLRRAVARWMARSLHIRAADK